MTYVMDSGPVRFYLPNVASFRDLQAILSGTHTHTHTQRRYISLSLSLGLWDFKWHRGWSTLCILSEMEWDEDSLWAVFFLLGLRHVYVCVCPRGCFLHFILKAMPKEKITFFLSLNSRQYMNDDIWVPTPVNAMEWTHLEGAGAGGRSWK